ncbi:Rid family detoxifying hydrolase [Klebsiella pneumoniae]
MRRRQYLYLQEKNEKIINTKAAPAAIGPYSQGVSFGNLVMTSGQLPLDPTTMAFPEGGVREQTRQSLLNLKAVLEQSGASLDTVLKTTCFLAKMEDFSVFNEVYSEFLVTQERQRVHAFRLANYPKKP